MNNNILSKVKEFIGITFREKGSSESYYHNFTHTAEVAKVASEIADAMGIDENEKEALLIAAWFHGEYLGVEHADSSPLFTPTCYAYAVSQVLVQTMGRAAICPIRNGLKYPVLILEAIAEHRIRGLSANPTSFKILLKTDAETELDLRSLRYAMGGGQFLARDVVDAMEARFGCPVVNQYGCTENSPRICFHWVREGEQPMPGRSLPVGKGVRGTEIRIAAEGSATSWNDLSGEFNLDFSPSRFRQYTIGRETARLTIDQRDRNDKKISLRSRIADFSRVGAFNTDYVIDLIDYEVRNRDMLWCYANKSRYLVLAGSI